MREQDAYVPCLTEAEDLIAGKHITLGIDDLKPNEIQRIDYLAQQ